MGGKKILYDNFINLKVLQDWPQTLKYFFPNIQTLKSKRKENIFKFYGNLLSAVSNSINTESVIYT